MNMDSFTFKILIIFLPGILGTFIIDKFTFHRERKSFYFLIHSFILGCISIFIYSCFGGENKDFTKILKNSPTNLDILIISIISILLSIILIALDKVKCFHKCFEKFKISNHSGELDTWAFYLNSDDTQWVTIRDKKEGLIYQGKVLSFSNGEKYPREIILGDVNIYEESNIEEKLYHEDFLYLSFPEGEKIIINS